MIEQFRIYPSPLTDHESIPRVGDEVVVDGESIRVVRRVDSDDGQSIDIWLSDAEP